MITLFLTLLFGSWILYLLLDILFYGLIIVGIVSIIIAIINLIFKGV